MGSKYTEIKNKTDLIFFLSVAKLTNETSVELSNIFNVLVECLSNFLPVHSYFSLSVAFYTLRRIEWSLRAFASMRALCLFFRARAMIKCVLRAASTLLNTTGEK